MECARALKAITARAGTFGLKPAILENKVAYVDMNDCPAVAALYSMRAVRELNIPLKYNVRLILGADEETGCRDTDCYYSHFKEAPCSYSPDGEYPVINLEKGGLYTSYSGTWEENTVLPCIRRIDGGTVGNAVPGKAEAVVEGISTDEIARAASAIGEQTGIAFRWEEKMGAL